MSGEITKAALMGARVSIATDCYPRPGGAKYIQVIVFGQSGTDGETEDQDQAAG